MMPPARVALMKRFVLLNESGKPASSASPAGRPIVRCQTPDVTTEMQIGGAELRDNIAFLPMELRDATDTAAASVRQITMGLVREDGDWKLLSLGLLLLDLPALEVEWDAAEVESTEKSALEALQKVAGAVEIPGAAGIAKVYEGRSDSLRVAAELQRMIAGDVSKNLLNLKASLAAVRCAAGGSAGHQRAAGQLQRIVDSNQHHRRPCAACSYDRRGQA